jgi:hypothetical protein
MDNRPNTQLEAPQRISKTPHINKSRKLSNRVDMGNSLEDY